MLPTLIRKRHLFVPLDVTPYDILGDFAITVTSDYGLATLVSREAQLCSCAANVLKPRSSISTATATKIKPISRSTAVTKRSPSTR